MDHVDMVSILDPMTPLRDPQGTLNTLRAGIIANGEALQQVNAGLVGLPVAAIQSNQAAIKKTNGRLTRTARGGISGNNATIGQVVQMLAGTVGGGLAGNAAALQTVQEIASTGGRVATTPTAGAPRCLYVDCAIYAATPIGSPIRNEGLYGYRIIGPCVGDTMPCPAALACSSRTWVRVPFFVDNGALGLDQFSWIDSQAGIDAVSAWCRSQAATAPAAQNWCLWYSCAKLPPGFPAGATTINDLGDALVIDSDPATLLPNNATAGFPGDWQRLQCGFASQATAEAYAMDNAESIIQTLAQKCVAAPAPPSPTEAPPPPPPEPGQQCVTLQSCTTTQITPCALTDTSLVLPAIGSAEFIAGAQSMRGWFVQLGMRVIDFLKGQVDTFSPPDTASQQTAPDAPSWAQILLPGLASTLLSYVNEGGDAAAKQLKNTVDCWKQLADQFTGCDLPETVLLCISRAVIELLQRFRIGWDIAIWGTLDITVHLDPIVKVLDYLIQDSCPAELPAIGDSIEAWLKGGMDDATFTAFLRFQGADHTVWQSVTRSRRERISDIESIQYQRRLRQDDATIQASLRDYGYISDDDRAARIEMSYELPTISDHLHWLQRNVFDTEYVQQYNLLDGFASDATIQAIPGFAGYVQRFPLGRSNFWTEFGPDLHALGMRLEYAARHYAAHWVQPSMGQLGEMVCRLRPGRVDQSIQFTPDDFLRLLGENDIAPFFRQRLLNILYRTFPLRQLNQAAQQGRFSYDDLYQRWQDLCFSPFDADIMAHTTLVQAARTGAAQGKGWTAATISALAEEGLIDYNTAVARLQPQGFTPEQVTDLFDVAALKKVAADRKRYGDKAQRDYAGEALKALEDGYVDAGTASNALISAGYPPDAAALEIQTALLRAAAKATAQASGAIKRAFTRGDLDRAGAVAALESVGVQAGPAGQMVTIWALSITPRKRALSKGEAIKLYTEGVMTITELENRLNNLGYNARDIAMLVAEARQNIDRANARAEQRSAAALARAERDTAAASAAILRGYCRLWPASKLIKLFSLRIIDESDISAKRAKCGDSSESITDLIKQATVARDKLDLEAAKKGEAGVQYTGPDSVTGGPTS